MPLVNDTVVVSLMMNNPFTIIFMTVNYELTEFMCIFLLYSQIILLQQSKA